ncbi:germination protein YpeB [Bacillus sp. S/N-304-OC-R1]|uniref:germination protein YpeB n=1 Tax=Bacillus sp. S/N-304-OC-R1 TaxID=2758034 RepID=UPI001C8D18A1|nr:germination protein YpeB [Bacillus sp. S/N-304-OC-R1]MBY0122568.1 germination protein YpeB [Bacillus sp. S/N-304-OC-R1]
MLRGILIGVLTLGVAGTAFWGYQEHREKNAILINAENSYQRAFHTLTYKIDLLHDKIGTTLAMNSRKSLSPALADVWRLTSEAHSNVGQLPLTLLPFNKTEEFLANIGDFSYRTAVRDLDKEPLTDKEYENLKKLYSHSEEIQQELRKVQHLVLKNNLRWMDVEMALASGKETADNTIIDGFKTVEKTVEGYGETDLGPTNVSLQRQENNFKHLKGRQISEDEAVKIASKYSGLKNNLSVNVTENGKGSDYGFYSVALLDQKTKQEASMDITKRGGYPIWFILSRDINNQKISLNEASNRAINFLNENGFKDLDLFESAQYNNTGVFNFVSTQDHIRIYPDSIRIKIALDNGGIVGLSATNYLQHNHKRNIQKPAISLEDARSKINPQLKVMEDRLAVIENDLKEEVLCYEFLGTLGNDTYRIFINADDGHEEMVEKLKNAEPIYDEVI